MKPSANTIHHSSCRQQWPWAGSLCLILLGWGTSVQAAEPIPIPVPPPEVTTLAPISPPEPQSVDTRLERLPVPSTPIPIGYVGADVTMNQLPPPPDTTGIDTAPSGRSLATGGRFRVIVFDVREGDIANQERLRSLVPEVLPINTGQQRALQVGSFQNEIQASELRAYMEVNGFRAEIQRLP